MQFPSCDGLRFSHPTIFDRSTVSDRLRLARRAHGLWEQGAKWDYIRVGSGEPSRSLFCFTAFYGEYSQKFIYLQHGELYWKKAIRKSSTMHATCPDVTICLPPPETHLLDSTYEQLHPAQNFVQDAGLISQDGSFGRPAFFWKNAT